MRVASLVILILATVVLSTCSRDVNTFDVRAARAVRVRAEHPPLGFDPGVALTSEAGTAITNVAIAGAAIPSAGAEDVRMAFVAFTTAAAADDADGAGTPLDDSLAMGADANAAEDVFVAAVVNPERMVRGQAFPTGFRQSFAWVFRDQRCERCHGFLEEGGLGESPEHRGSTDLTQCTQCHTAGEIRAPGVAEPAHIVWNAARGVEFRAMDEAGLFEQAMRGRPTPDEHLRDDGKILWAIGHGHVPFDRIAAGGPVPMSVQDWQDSIDAWSLAGLPFDSAAGAVKDVALASRRASAATAGNAGAQAPAITFVPNGSFVPGSGDPAGWVHVAYASDATDVIDGVPSPNRDVYVTRLAVNVTFDAGLELETVTLAFADVALVSESRLGKQGGDGASDRPAISADGGRVAYRSAATDLVDGFEDGNGTGLDVFLCDMPAGAPAGTTALVSRSLIAGAGGVGERSGAGDSSAPAISADGAVIAFASAAQDLVGGDSNGETDVFYAREEGGVRTVHRASVRTGGAEVGGGPSGKPSVWHDPDTDEVWVAYESEKVGLDPATAARAETPGAFLHWSGGNRTTRLGRASLAATRAPQLSADGARVVFTSSGGDLDPSRDDGNGTEDLFSFDLAAFRRAPDGPLPPLERLSLAASGGNANEPISGAVIGAVAPGNGRHVPEQMVAYFSAATNLGGSANSPLILQFLRDRTSRPTVAAFAADSRRGFPINGQLEISFRDLSTFTSADGQAWRWDFGDGSTSVEQNPRHLYLATDGSEFTVTLTVTDKTGRSHTLRRERFVTLTDFSGLYEDVLAGCSGCHNPDSFIPPARALNLADADAAYEALVGDGTGGVMTTTSRCESQAFERVVPGNPDASLLYLTLLPRQDPRSPDCATLRDGSSMGEAGGLAPSQIEEVRAWIQEGAVR
ncbi:MAG: PKD domain-containing protein [Planctomycetota bacterium]